MIALVVAIAVGGALAISALLRWALRDDDAMGDDDDPWKDGGCE